MGGDEKRTEDCREVTGRAVACLLHTGMYATEHPAGICVFSVGITEWHRDGVGGSGMAVP